MLQISYSVNFVPIITVVNTLWYISLVLSIGAALNSVLAMAWRQSIQYVLSIIVLAFALMRKISHLAAVEVVNSPSGSHSGFTGPLLYAL